MDFPDSRPERPFFGAALLFHVDSIKVARNMERRNAQMQ
jgi:hypothetical protein